jgi:hypothetical protein
MLFSSSIDVVALSLPYLQSDVKAAVNPDNLFKK